jgi:WD40 repeat protein
VGTAVINEAEGLAAITGVDGSVAVFDLQTGLLSAQFEGDHNDVPEILAMSPGGNHLAAAIEEGAALILWDIAAGKATFTLEEPARVSGLLFEPGGRVVMTARSNHTIERRDIRSGAILETMRGHSSPVEVMAFAPNEVTLASGSRDGMIFIWDMDDNSVLNRIHAHAGAITGLAFSADGNFLYSTGTDGKLHLWRVSNGALEDTIADQASPLNTLSLLDAQGLLSSVLQGDQIGFWTNSAVEISAPLGGLFGAVKAQQLSTTGDQLLVIDGDGVVQSYQIAESIAPDEDELIAAKATRTPSAGEVQDTQTNSVALQSALPAPLYYLSDVSGSAQVWRMESDGVTTSQITFEDYPVTSFDVALGTDHLAFVSNNDLILTDKSGSTRWMIQDGETFPPNAVEEAQRKAITDIHFSPNGWQISYGMNGVHIYSILNDSDSQFMENSNVGTDSSVVYRPLMFSPGGNNLYIQIEEGEDLSLMVVSSWTGEEYATFDDGPCCQPQINANQDAVYFTRLDNWGNPVGLWLVDIWNDTSEEILPATGNQAEQINAFPIQDPFTEDLIFFYADHEKKAGVSLSMARASDDGVSLLQVIRADSYTNLTDVLWAPDASLALVSEPVSEEITILYVEDRPAIPLGIQGTMMRWGN